MPLEGYQIDPENGKDIMTNIDVNIQDIAENALYNELVSNEATHGACIVMEVKTGKIRAIANLGRQPNGSYAEDYNYAIADAAEPGSVFKLATLLSLLNDHYVTINSPVEISTDYSFGKRIMHDAEHHPTEVVSVKEALEMSSNVGFSKLAYTYYKNDPQKYVNDLKKLGLDQKTGIDLEGEVKPVIVTPQSRTWSSTALPWMSIGYEVLQTPIRLLTLYNAVANNGVMMKPYLVNSIEQYGKVVRQFEPVVLNPKICSDTVLQQVQSCLEGVVESKEGTAHAVLDNPYYKIAGKTGTAQVANGPHGYADHIYQATFCGYFPADHPMYSIIVTILNKPHAAHIYGASVAAPVFKAIADKLYALNFEKQIPSQSRPVFDSTLQIKTGQTDELKTILTKLDLPVSAGNMAQPYANATVGDQHVYLKPVNIQKGSVPDVRGMGLKDALYLLENAGLKVMVQGKGKVTSQSLQPGQAIGKDNSIAIQLS